LAAPQVIVLIAPYFDEVTAVDNHLGTWAVFGSDVAGYELFLPAVMKP